MVGVVGPLVLFAYVCPSGHVFQSVCHHGGLYQKHLMSYFAWSPTIPCRIASHVFSLVLVTILAAYYRHTLVQI